MPWRIGASPGQGPSQPKPNPPRRTYDRRMLRTDRMKIKRRMWISACVLVALLIAKYFLLDTPAEATGSYAIDIEALHRVAIAGGGLPERIEVEKIGDF